MAGLTLTLALLSAANTASGFVAQRRAATMAEQQGQAEGGLFDTNASLADAQAQDAIRRGDQAASDEDVRAAQLAGAQTVAGAAAGLDISSGGSVQDVMASDRRLSMIDQTTLRQNARREAWGFQTQAAGYRTQGQWARAAGANRAAGLRTGATSTLLSGAGQLANLWNAAPKSVSSASVPAAMGGYVDTPKKLPPGQAYG